jgi:hypothetical protein
VLADRGLYVEELVPVRRDLESVFLELTADDHLGATQVPRSRRARFDNGPGMSAKGTTPLDPRKRER